MTIATAVAAVVYVNNETEQFDDITETLEEEKDDYGIVRNKFSKEFTGSIVAAI